MATYNLDRSNLQTVCCSPSSMRAPSLVNEHVKTRSLIFETLMSGRYIPATCKHSGWASALRLPTVLPS